MSDNIFLTPDFLKKIAYNEIGWSTCYDRNRTPDIKADVEVVFKKLGALLSTDDRIERYYKLHESGLLSA